MALTRGAVRPDGTTAVAGVRWVVVWSGGCRSDRGRLDAATVAALAVRPPLGVHHVLVVLHRPHVVERGDHGRDRPEERHDQLQEDSPEAEEVPHPQDAPERAVAAELGVAPVEEPVDRGGVLERRLDLGPLAERPADAGQEVLADVLEQRRLEAASRVVGEVRLARRGDRHDAPHRGEGEPQHRQQRAARVAGPHEVPGEHADGHQVERQSDPGPGEASRPRLLQVDRLGLELARIRPGGPGRGTLAAVADLAPAEPRPRPVDELEGHAEHEHSVDHQPGPAGFGPLQRLLREDQAQQVADPGEGRVPPQSQVGQPVHRRQMFDLSPRCVKQRLSPFRKVSRERRVPSQVSVISFYYILVNNIV